MPSTAAQGKSKTSMPKNNSRKVHSHKKESGPGDKQMSLLTSSKKLRVVGQSNSSPRSGGGPSNDTAGGKENCSPAEDETEYPRDLVSDP
jgi:hypothetical protein